MSTDLLSAAKSKISGAAAEIRKFRKMMRDVVGTFEDRGRACDAAEDMVRQSVETIGYKYNRHKELIGAFFPIADTETTVLIVANVHNDYSFSFDKIFLKDKDSRAVSEVLDLTPREKADIKLFTAYVGIISFES